MSHAIHKFKLDVTRDVQEIELPRSFQLLSVQAQSEHICLWGWVALDDQHTFRHQYRVIGTGWEVSDEDFGHLYHVATVQIGPFVWHVFQLGADFRIPNTRDPRA